MCYIAIVVTKQCENGHDFDAQACWRQCFEHSSDCAQGRSRWNSRCDNLMDRIVTVNSDVVDEVDADDCYVCINDGVTYADTKDHLESEIREVQASARQHQADIDEARGMSLDNPEVVEQLETAKYGLMLDHFWRRHYETKLELINDLIMYDQTEHVQARTLAGVVYLDDLRQYYYGSQTVVEGQVHPEGEDAPRSFPHPDMIPEHIFKHGIVPGPPRWDLHPAE